jgi:hypothetical protein
VCHWAKVFFPPKPFRMHSVRFAPFLCYDIWVHTLQWPSCPSLFFLRRNCASLSLFSRDSHITSSSRGAAGEGEARWRLGPTSPVRTAAGGDEPSHARTRASRLGKCDTTMAWSLSPKPVGLNVVQGWHAKFFTAGQGHEAYLKLYFWIFCSKENGHKATPWRGARNERRASSADSRIGFDGNDGVDTTTTQTSSSPRCRRRRAWAWPGGGSVHGSQQWRESMRR